MSLFITFEGGEGSGKSYQTKALYRHLCRMSVPCILAHEPGSTPLGERLSRLLKEKRSVPISSLGELLLFNAARAQLVADVIQPALKAGRVVICDRYADSTVAYQGYGRGLDIVTVRSVNNVATGGLSPDLTVLLDVPVKTGLGRKASRANDRFEKETIAFHERVRKGYRTLAKEEPGRFLVVDGRQTRRRIAGIIREKVSALRDRIA